VLKEYLILTISCLFRLLRAARFAPADQTLVLSLERLM
jgi:hypothetical protein